MQMKLKQFKCLKRRNKCTEQDAVKIKINMGKMLKQNPTTLKEEEKKRSRKTCESFGKL